MQCSVFAVFRSEVNLLNQKIIDKERERERENKEKMERIYERDNSDFRLMRRLRLDRGSLGKDPPHFLKKN